MNTFDASIIFEAPEIVREIPSSLKPNYYNQVSGYSNNTRLSRGAGEGAGRVATNSPNMHGGGRGSTKVSQGTFL